ncbi:MAG: purine-nucleoside phosphorylase [Saprospiraceae bacterium]|nr:purine-nucleoside phosphorylase [Saprospiraceae bacterium]
MQLFEQISEAVSYISQRVQFAPKFGLVLGTGLGSLVKEIEIVASFPYSALPHFPVSTVKSHEGKLVLGYLAGQAVVAMAGRFHYYEGYTMAQVTFPIRVLKRLGISTLLISNAAGSTNASIEAGDLVFIRDHINLQPENPLRGENDERIGPRFPDMLDTYHRDWNAKALAFAATHAIRAHEGIYVGLQGPNLETPAEYRFLNLIGGDVVGMSTVPEVLVAKHEGLSVFVASVVSNKCYPTQEIKPTTIEDVIQVVEDASPKLQLIVNYLLNKDNGDDTTAKS